MTFTTSSGQRIETSALLGKGGEGEVWAIKGDSSQVAKLYYPKNRQPEREAKIQAMVANPPKDETRNFNPPHVSIAWPTALLYDQGNFVGYLMPRIENSPDIVQVFNTKARAKGSLTHFDWRYMHRVAQNFAIALHALHDKGDVMGDVNQKNVLVTNAAMVTLVDTDSFQIQDGHRTFRCTVGVPDYTPPELQGQKLETIDRSAEHDRFGLAVLIFQLLMNGFHPFTGAPKDPKFSVEGGIYLYCIKNGIFPYQDNSKIKPPPQAPAIANLHPDLQALFVRCFVAGHHQPNLRPNTQDWMDALKVAEQNLVQCHKIQEHWHGNHLKKCPWCAQSGNVLITALPTQQPMPAPPPKPTKALNQNTSRQFMGRRKVIAGLGAAGVVATLWGGQQVRTRQSKQMQGLSLPTEIFRFETVTVDDMGKVVNREIKQARIFQERIGETILDLVFIPGGTFLMGTPASETGAGSSDFEEGPQTTVTLEPFLLGKFLVTQSQWKAVFSLPKASLDLEDLARSSTSEDERKLIEQALAFEFKGDNRPAEIAIKGLVVVEFLQRLSQYAGMEYRLPSEAEWEYACRAGSTTPFHFGSTITTDLANFDGQVAYGKASKGIYRGETTDVGSFPPNAFGLYDMHGNLAEVCADLTDGGEPVRGGSWLFPPEACRSAWRGAYTHGAARVYGFRVCCSDAKLFI